MDNNETESTKKVFSKEQLQRMSNDALKSINDDETIEIKMVSKEEPETTLEVEEEPEVVEEPTTEEVAETPENDEKPNNKKKLIIIIIVAVVLALLLVIGGIVGFIIYRHNHNKPKKIESIIVKKDNYRYENGKLILIDNDKEIGSYNCKNKDTKLCYVANYSNTEDKFLVPSMYYENNEIVEDVSDFINKQYAFIIDGKDSKIIIYDFINKKEIDKIDKVKYYGNNNYAILVKNNKYGLADLANDGIKFLIDYTYDYMGVVLGNGVSDTLVVKKDSSYQIIDYTNKALSKEISGAIRQYNDQYIIAGEDEKLYLYDYKNKLVLNKSFSYIKLLKDYIIVVNDLDLLVLDYEGNKYNISPITLKNKNYVAKNVYDKKGKKIRTEAAFEETIKDSKLIITIMGDPESKVSIDLLEGKVSANLKYVNYLDGVLYFYSDEDKTELLGKYTCTNKNTINEDTTALNNCFVAKDTIYENNDMEDNSNKTVGIIPIINDTFVFINDSKPTDSKKTIKLYNLKTSKVLGGYQNVCTYLFSGLEEVSFAEINDLNFIARNSTGKMGLIKINNDEVSNGIKFNYLSLEKMGKYYLGKTSNAKYILIYDDTATNTSIEFNGPIKGYNKDYIKVNESNKYAIYDFEGNKINNVNYKYIEIYDDFYAAVNDSNSLALYKYSNNDQILSDEIKLYSNKYTDSENPAFKLDKYGFIVTISVLKDDIYTIYEYDLTTGMRVEG